MRARALIFPARRKAFMANNLEALLVGLRDETAPTLAGVESGLWREIHRQRARGRILGAIGCNTGIAAAGLVIGIAAAVTRPLPPPEPVSIPLLLTEVPPASLLE